jgi:EF hand
MPDGQRENTGLGPVFNGNFSRFAVVFFQSDFFTGVIMRLRASSIVAALAWFALLTATSHAQAAGSTALLQKWDVDHDGTLSLDEAKSAASGQFDKLDTDHDGTLTEKELGGRLSHSAFQSADPDHDGTLSKEEYLTVVERRFRAADPDKDGTLDATELDSRAGHLLSRLL